MSINQQQALSHYIVRFPLIYILSIIVSHTDDTKCALDAHFRARAGSAAIYSSPRVAHPRGAFFM